MWENTDQKNSKYGQFSRNVGEFSEALSTITLNKFSTFWKFGTFYDEPICCCVCILDGIVFFQSQIVKDKNEFKLNWLWYLWFLFSMVLDNSYD